MRLAFAALAIAALACTARADPPPIQVVPLEHPDLWIAAQEDCAAKAVSRHLTPLQETACIEEAVVRAVREEARAELYEMHLACRAVAETRFLGGDEALGCAAVFQRLKLSFLEGNVADRATDLKPALRATANSKGYAAFVAWENARRAAEDHLQD